MEKWSEVLRKLKGHSLVKEGLVFLQEDDSRTLEEQIELTLVPAPSFMEEKKGNVFKKKLSEYGLQGIEQDYHGNVYGIRHGKGNGPRIFVCAHLDTVFPEGTQIQAQWKDGKVYAPGISDDGRGLAAVLSVLRAFEKTNIQTEGDIIFGATVGEEGLGDLKGVKGLFADREDIQAFLSLEPGTPEEITYLGTGSHRYHVTYTGSGGHSFGDFGIPSATHALGRAISKIADIETPTEPKTTFTVGTITGGTSVNTIAQEASMMVDLRSNAQSELLKLEEKVVAIFKEAAEEENDRWESSKTKIEVDIKLVGNRPPGTQSSEATIVQTALAANKVLGLNPVLADALSTDSNVPISLGIPAVTLGAGGECGGIHTLEEYFDPKNAYLGPQNLFLTILGLVGVYGETEPLLKK
ncbi:M20/M25/M40 family metallo-hydrolase [Bacillus sp. B1-b2]|uniref:M20/M25/M40 family metallo-hydrolase n=1 Tax=Bacillus sp. B1-b2 TaxID=2653201 RepID=UPI0012618B3A|nr:M20/M25/M40 family metallo-hydrolase [Bacillus sp. B1-b2]KAB7664880.1 M20/M25/M40 family metallo-hydrolase [Bacillus sp. B1-b2]